MKKFKKGAASFYIVAFSTLILLIIAASFAAIIISEVTRTSNDDLSQSAYDSALAGVEDAKLAFYNYRNCKANKKNENCDAILKAMESGECNMVAQMLSRGDGEVLIKESNDAALINNMSQAYTCVKINTSLKDYRGTLSPSDQIKVIKAKFSNTGEHEVSADKIDSVRISWYSDRNLVSSGLQYTNVAGEAVNFQKLGGESSAAAPPTIFLAVVQMGPNFNLDDFKVTKNNQTNRGMVYLVPTNNASHAATSKIDNYNKTTYDSVKKTNNIQAAALSKSNDKKINNLPYMVYCDPNSDAEFTCSATVSLPKPIGGKRDNENFYIVVGLPYGKPTADFALEFFCAANVTCTTVTTETVSAENGSVSQETKPSNQANLEGVQIEVDSTGRANDMFRRVQARLENPDNLTLSIMGPLELLGDGNPDGDGLLNKKDPVRCEYNFTPSPTC